MHFVSIHIWRSCAVKFNTVSYRVKADRLWIMAYNWLILYLQLKSKMPNLLPRQTFIMIQQVSCPESIKVIFIVLHKAVCHRHKLLSPSPSQSEELICILLWLAAYCSAIKPPPGPTQSLSDSCHPLTVCRTSNDFHLSCLVLYVVKPVSKGPCNVTLPHIPPVSL